MSTRPARNVGWSRASAANSSTTITSRGGDAAAVAAIRSRCLSSALQTAKGAACQPAVEVGDQPCHMREPGQRGERGSPFVVDQQERQPVGRRGEREAGDEGPQQLGLAGTGGSGDQQVRTVPVQIQRHDPAGSDADRRPDRWRAPAPTQRVPVRPSGEVAPAHPIRKTAGGGFVQECGQRGHRIGEDVPGHSGQHDPPTVSLVCRRCGLEDTRHVRPIRTLLDDRATPDRQFLTMLCGADGHDSAFARAWSAERGVQQPDHRWIADRRTGVLDDDHQSGRGSDVGWPARRDVGEIAAGQQVVGGGPGSPVRGHLARTGRPPA